MNEEEQVKTVQSYQVRYPIYTVRAAALGREAATECGVYHEETSGDYLGLLFSSRQNALTFVYQNAIDETTNEIHEIPTQSRLVQMARRIRDRGEIGSFVVDYGSYDGESAVEIPIDEIARLVIPEDSDDPYKS